MEMSSPMEAKQAKTRPKIVVLAGLGLNGEHEMERAFVAAGGNAQRVAVTEFLEEAEAILAESSIFAIPGGFSFGDDLGAGNGLAQLLCARAAPVLTNFIARGGLVLGVCNGCQVLVRMGLVGAKTAPTKDIPNKPKLAITDNASGQYEARFSYLTVPENAAAHFWFAGAELFHLPVAHGEGRFVVADRHTEAGGSSALLESGLVALRYSDHHGALAQGAYPANPNGSTLDIAAVSDASGQVLAMMPHPERVLTQAQSPDWHRLAEARRRAEYKQTGQTAQEEQGGMADFTPAYLLFANAVKYASLKSQSHPTRDSKKT